MIIFPLWNGSYIDREAQYEHYGPWGIDDRALCVLRLLITESDSTFTVKISYNADIPGYLTDIGTFTFLEVPGDSDTGLTKAVDLDGIRYKFSCSRSGGDPNKITLRYLVYRISSDGSTNLQLRIDGILK